MPDFYGQDFTGSFTGMPGAEGEVPYSINVDTAKLEGAIDIFQNALHQVTDMLGRVVSGVQSVGGAVGSFFSSGSAPPSGFSPPPLSYPYQTTNMSEAGRYVGHPTYFQSMMGAVGMRSSPFMPSVDYQQMMSRDFAERTTLLGGSVASVGAEMGAGYLGSKLLKPLFGKGMFGTLAGGMTGYMAAAYPLEHLMGKINEGFEFDKLIGDVSSRSGINEGLFDQGFNRGHRREITKNLRSTGRELNLGMGDFADIMQYGGEAGMFRGVTDSEQFTDTIKVAAKNLKSLMMVLREPDVSEAIRDMSTFQQWGVPLAEQSSFAQQAAVTGRMLGITAKGAIQIAAVGAEMGPQFGYSKAYGSEMSMFGATVGESMLRSKAMTRAELSVYGGAEGFGQAFVQHSMQGAGSPAMKNLMGAFLLKDGTVDKKLLNDFLSEKLDSSDMREIVREKHQTHRELFADIQDFPQMMSEQFSAFERNFMPLMLGREIKARYPNMPTHRAYSIPEGLGPQRGYGLEKWEQGAMQSQLEELSAASSAEALRKRRGQITSEHSIVGKIKRGYGAVQNVVDWPFDRITDAAVDAVGEFTRGISTVRDYIQGVHAVQFPEALEVPEDIMAAPGFQGRLRSEYESIKERAGESGRGVPYEIMDKIKADIGGLGKKWYHSDVTDLFTSFPGEKLSEEHKADPRHFLGRMMRGINDVQSMGPHMKTDQTFDALASVPPEELQRFGNKMGVNIAMLDKHPDVQGRTGLFGRNIPGGSEMLPGNQYDQLRSQDWIKEIETTTYGAKDPASEQAAASGRHSTAMDRHADALNKATAGASTQGESGVLSAIYNFVRDATSLSPGVRAQKLPGSNS